METNQLAYGVPLFSLTQQLRHHPPSVSSCLEPLLPPPSLLEASQLSAASSAILKLASEQLLERV